MTFKVIILMDILKSNLSVSIFQTQCQFDVFSADYTNLTESYTLLPSPLRFSLSLFKTCCSVFFLMFVKVAELTTLENEALY